MPHDEGGDGAAQVVKAEVQEKPGDGLVKVARPGQVVAGAARSMGEMLSELRPMARQGVDTFSEPVRGPQEITVEFGLSMSAGADIDATVIKVTAAQVMAVSECWIGRS